MRNPAAQSRSRPASKRTCYAPITAQRSDSTLLARTCGLPPNHCSGPGYGSFRGAASIFCLRLESASECSNSALSSRLPRFRLSSFVAGGEAPFAQLKSPLGDGKAPKASQKVVLALCASAIPAPIASTDIESKITNDRCSNMR
jgi:hypothetical protein